MDLFPKDFSSYPSFYTDKELEWLEGSPFLIFLSEHKKYLKSTYEEFCKEIPEFKKHDFMEFKQAM